MNKRENATVGHNNFKICETSTFMHSKHKIQLPDQELWSGHGKPFRSYFLADLHHVQTVSIFLPLSGKATPSTP